MSLSRLSSLFLAAATAATTPLAAASPASTPSATAPTQDYRARLPEDEVIYFVLPDRFANGDPANDRGGLTGNRLRTGYDPTDTGFYHGGDLKGLKDKLDYIQGLGATALWIGPVFRNKPVQCSPDGKHCSAGYHGYWIEGFDQIDPHFGTEADMKALVDAAHARGMKVYLDIVINHTADVIQYRECQTDAPCAYRDHADYPYSRRGGVDGKPINPGFLGDDAAHQTAANFAKLTSPDYAYTPFVPADEAHAKSPAWLNDPIYYHNRGDSTFEGESSTFGDFSGLDDVMTENPRVVQGMIAIYGGWIDRLHVDGFRIDTERHVNPEFWRAFVPAMLARAKADGIPNFHIFGEVANPDPSALARHTVKDHIPAVLDFAFQERVARAVGGDGATQPLADYFADDVNYRGGEETARRLVTFLGNHDMGRALMQLRKARPGIGDAKAMRRLDLGYAMLFFLRGTPAIYYGGEQGLAGEGGDQASRQDMFPSRTPSYRAETGLGETHDGSVSRFDAANPLYRAIAAMAKLRTATPALREGDQITRAAGDKPGLFAVSRHAADGREVLAAFNTSDQPFEGQVQVDARSTRWRSLMGRCAAESSAPGSYRVSLPPLGYMVCEAEEGGR